ncbi:MAG: nucleotidyltransferase domain-containing protein [Chthonomonas sp.]|nr:nucleotidyltransferase domain-containing protein [Chthonomonas sp.]
MIRFDEQTSDSLRELCRSFAVRHLKLFGSAVGPEFDDNRSDLDFLVEFSAPPSGMGLAEQYFGFLEELQALLGRSVDLLEESAIENTRLKRQALEQAVTLYAA